jgi:methionyl aminopeptidase
VRIPYKSSEELKLQREAGLVAAEILHKMCEAAKPGVSTWELDQIARREIDRHKVKSAFLGYAQPPYPAVVCTSINEVIVHGIPRKSAVLADGDIIGIDFGIYKHGFCADTARTVLVGNVSAEKRDLVTTARESLDRAIELCRVGNRLGDLGHAVQSHAESRGYSVVRQFVGHGTGRQMHEDPQVPNYGAAGSGKRLKTGLVIAVEPMVNAGTPDVEVLDDEWTAVTKDRSMSAHFEHTIAITDEGPWVLTRPSSTPGNPGQDP